MRANEHDTFLNTGFEIFLELASDNLDEKNIALFNQQFEQNGILELYDPNEDWLDYVEGETLDSLINNNVEVNIGLVNNENTLSTIFARLLLPLDHDDKTCHIIWAED